MKNKTSVSVLVTFFNQEQYVNTALDSIFGQKGDFSLKVLIGDDGSTDKTMDFIRQWKSKYPDLISVYRLDHSREENQIGGFRASGNRLNLIKHVETDYFIFLDGDDYFDDENKLQKQISILEDPVNMDCVACGHEIYAEYDNGERKPFVRLREVERKISLAEYWPSIYVHTDTLLVRSSVIERLPLKLVKNHFNDNMITFLILQHGNLYYLPLTMAVYRQTGTGIWTGDKLISQNIRNMFLYDLAIQINPLLKQESRIRFANAWKVLFHNRRMICKEELIPYYNEADRNNLMHSKMWIDYRIINVESKTRLLLQYLIVCINALVFRVIRKLKKPFCGWR